MKIHELKTWTKYFDLVADGKKSFEWRKNDRTFQEGDLIYLREWDNEHASYTGRAQLVQIILIVSCPEFGMPEGYVIMEIKLVKLEITPLPHYGIAPKEVK